MILRENQRMEQYLSLVHETYKHGNLRGNRTDTRAKSMFGGFMKFDLTTEFPLLRECQSARNNPC